MKEIILKNLDQSIYAEKLNNGLNVILIPMLNKENYYVNYSTKYGSMNLNFMFDGKKYESPKGIAHFLEHKMFEQPNGDDVFDYYAKTGTECNAGTGHKKTSYYIYGLSNLDDNLNYLIDLVNTPYFTDDNVEKEKGIIIEELKMYSDDPDWALNEAVQFSLYKNHPIKYDIGGYCDTVRKITKEDLYKCYNTYYQPSNMLLTISGKFDKDKIIELIKSNESLNSRSSNNKIEELIDKEPSHVVKKHSELSLENVAVSKVEIAFKLSIKDVDDKALYNFYVSAILSILFGSVSSFNEDMFKKGYASYIDYQKTIVDDLMIIEFYIEGEKPKELLNEIMNRFKNGNIDEIELERFKKVLIANTVINSDKPQAIAESIINDFFEYGMICENKIEVIKKMNLKKLKQIKSGLELDNNVTVYLKSKECDR